MKKSKKQIKRHLGNRLKIAREALGLSQRDFARKMEMSNSHLSDIELGRFGPGYYFFYQLTLYHKINPYFLLHGEGPIFLEPPVKALELVEAGSPKEKTDIFGADSLMDENVELMKKSPLVRLAVMQFVTQYALQNKELIEADIMSRRGNQLK